MRLWSQGEARVVCNSQPGAGEPALAAVGYQVTDPAAAAERAERLLAPRVHRTTYAGEEELRAVAAPDGTEVYLGRRAGWVDEFDGGRPARDTEVVTTIDHVNLVQPWQHYDEAVLFHASLLALETQSSTEVAGPAGLVRSQVMRSTDGRVRMPLNLLPVGHPGLAQHVAFACDDVLGLGRAAVARGLRPLTVPGNYYDDLAARFDLDPDLLERMREVGVLYDRDEGGEFLHLYTATVGGVFFEAVERRGDYDGYGAPNAPVRMAAQLG